MHALLKDALPHSAGLVQQLQQAMATIKDNELQAKPPLSAQLTLDLPVNFATVHAAVSSHTPQLTQASLLLGLHSAQQTPLTGQPHCLQRAATIGISACELSEPKPCELNISA